MEDVEIPCKIIGSPDDLLEQIPELAVDCDYLIIDGPANLSEATRAILFRLDLAFIPVQPTGVDLRSASDAMRIVKQAQSVEGGLPKAVMFLSRAVKGTKLKDEAIADTSGQLATVWDISGRPASESASDFRNQYIISYLSWQQRVEPRQILYAYY